jgi:hypothetical protein
MHNVRLIRRRFPRTGNTIVLIAVVVSLSLLVAGVGMLLG